MQRPRLLLAVMAGALGVAVATLDARQVPELSVGIAARGVQPGEVVRIDVRCRCRDAVPRAVLRGADVPLVQTASKSGTAVWEGLIGLDLDMRPGVYPLTIQGQGIPEHTVDLHVVPKQFASRRLQLAPGFVDPDPADLQRISTEAAALEALFKSVTPRRWSGAFVPPAATTATSNFGTRSVFNGQPRNPHAGVDFRGSVGTPVVAPAAGRVVLADNLFFTGNTVVIDHGLGLISLLAHLSAIAVAQADLVDRDTLVGRVGATGRVTGPHLHWAIRLISARVDPLSLLFATQEEQRPAERSR